MERGEALRHLPELLQHKAKPDLICPAHVCGPSANLPLISKTQSVPASLQNLFRQLNYESIYDQEFALLQRRHTYISPRAAHKNQDQEDESDILEEDPGSDRQDRVPTAHNSNNARAYILSRCLSAPLPLHVVEVTQQRESAGATPPLLHVYTSTFDTGNGERGSIKRRTFFQRLKSLILRNTKAVSLDNMDVYTYVCQHSRMMHHSHGADSSIIDMF
jgi:hypothetical protein